MDEQQEIERLRDHWHELRTAMGETVTAVAVIGERQKAQGVQLDRIEAVCTKLADKSEDHTGRLTVLETRQADAATAGAKWGAGLGAGVSAAIAGLWQLVKGQ